MDMTMKTSCPEQLIMNLNMNPVRGIKTKYCCKDKTSLYFILRTIETRFDTPMSYQTYTTGVQSVGG